MRARLAMLSHFSGHHVPTGIFLCDQRQGSGCASCIPTDTRRSLGLMSAYPAHFNHRHFATFRRCWIFLFPLHFAENVYHALMGLVPSPAQTLHIHDPDDFGPLNLLRRQIFLSPPSPTPRRHSCFNPMIRACFSLSHSQNDTIELLLWLHHVEGCFTRPQLRSVRCSKPSIPPRSTNSRTLTFFTHVAARPGLRSACSINAARLACSLLPAKRSPTDTTTCPRARLFSV